MQPTLPLIDGLPLDDLTGRLPTQEGWSDGAPAVDTLRRFSAAPWLKPTVCPQLAVAARAGDFRAPGLRFTLPVLSADGKEALAVVSSMSSDFGISDVYRLVKVGSSWRIASRVPLSIS